ncbi:hypothetical protein S245_056316, partial [Arachis hypogaea]
QYLENRLKYLADQKAEWINPYPHNRNDSRVMLATVRCEEIAREKYKAAKEELHQLEEDMKRSPTEYLNRLSSQIDTCLS